MLGVEAGINSLPFAIFVTPKQRKMNIRERIGTLHSRLEVKNSSFQHQTRVL